MFLVRSVFWLALVLLILPPASDGSPPPRVSLFQAVSAARIFANDIAGACERNPKACEIGGDTVNLVGRKAKTGIDIVGSIISSGRDSTPHSPSNARTPDSGTLTDEDLLTEWAAGAGD